MELFTERPEKILGNVALASLLAGLPMGLFMALLGALLNAPVQWGLTELKNIFLGALVGTYILFMCGLFLFVPVLLVLRRLGYAGPFFVYALSAIFAAFFFTDGIYSGLTASAMVLAFSYVFCRFAYADSRAWPSQAEAQSGL